MNYDQHDHGFDNIDQPHRNRLPLVLGLAGVVFAALSFGFVIASAVGGLGGSPASEPLGTETATLAPGGSESTTPDSGTASPAPTDTRVAATATPPTPGRTVPAINNPKFHDIFRAEGGQVSKNATSSLPFRRLEASYDNSYQGCPGAGCIRGRASVLAGVGPGGTGESPVASALVYNTFVAQRATASLLMDIRWNGSLAAVVGANVNTGVEIEIVVSEIDPATKKTIKAVPNMPYTVPSKELGLEAIQGVDTLKIEGSQSVNIPLKLDPGHLYRIDLKITCSTRAAFSLSATICSFFSTGTFAGVEWTKQVVEYDTGICSPTQRGDGCIYQD